MADKVKVYIEKCRSEAIIPTYANDGDAGMDICAAVSVDIYPGQTRIIPTGLKLAIPSGYEIQVRPRSGLSYKTLLRIANSPGTIDSEYRDELGIIISNTGADIKRIGSHFGYNSENVEENSLKELLHVYHLSDSDLSDSVKTTCIYRINIGDRIAQIVLSKLPSFDFVVVDNIANIGKNRGGGFGSSGV